MIYCARENEKRNSISFYYLKAAESVFLTLNENDVCVAIPYTIFRNCEEDEFYMQGSAFGVVYGDSP
jgi:hypothetical protein